MLRILEPSSPGHAVEYEHPLDPMSSAEISRTSAILREHFGFGDDIRFETIELVEPAKDVVRGFVPGTPIERLARFNVYRRAKTGVWTGKVDINLGKVDRGRVPARRQADDLAGGVPAHRSRRQGRSALQGGDRAARHRALRPGLRRSLDRRQFRRAR